VSDFRNDALYRAFVEQAVLDDYLEGDISEEQAYEYGLIDEYGQSLVDDDVWEESVDNSWKIKVGDW
jgi:hypothetical protein